MKTFFGYDFPEGNPNLSFPRYSIIELTCYSNEVQRRYICLGEL